MPARTAVAERYALTLDGAQIGFLQSVEGGNATAEVVSEAAGPSYFVKKHLGPLKYEDFVAQIDLSQGKPVYDWISAMWTMNYQRKNGSVVTLDARNQATSQQDFFNVLLTETTIPALDASSHDDGYLTIKFAPEYTRSVKPSGKVAAPAKGSVQKRWLVSNFRLEIDGLDCSRVSKIDSFTIKQKAVTDDIGDARDYQREPGKLEFPNLKISLAEIAAKSWIDWHEDFVIKGNNADAQEKSGALVFLAPNLGVELARIRFFNLGIFKLTPDKAEAGSEQIRRYTAELYCERMEFQYGA